jgi:CheY-like chemotaxis protein
MARSILVVQHDVPAQRHVASCLEDAGYRVIEARGFGDARRTLERQPPDLLITDVRLDGYNGLQLLVMSPEPIPAIVFTNLPDPVLEADARALGAEYLLKPVSRATLLARVAALLGGGEPSAQSFTSRRSGFRTRVQPGVPAHAAGCAATVLELSDRGVRLEIADVAGASLPHTFRFTVPPAGTVFFAKAVWKRHDGHGRWVYGAELQEHLQIPWKHLVDTRTLEVRLRERSMANGDPDSSV